MAGILDPRQFPMPMPRPQGMPPGAAPPSPIPGMNPQPGPLASPVPPDPMAGMSTDELAWRALTGQQGDLTNTVSSPQHVQEPDPTVHHIMSAPQMLELARAGIVSAKHNTNPRGPLPEPHYAMLKQYVPKGILDLIHPPAPGA